MEIFRMRAIVFYVACQPCTVALGIVIRTAQINGFANPLLVAACLQNGDADPYKGIVGKQYSKWNAIFAKNIEMIATAC